MHTYIHTCIHTYIHTYVRMYVPTYIHTHIHTVVWEKFSGKIRTFVDDVTWRKLNTQNIFTTEGQLYFIYRCLCNGSNCWLQCILIESRVACLYLHRDGSIATVTGWELNTGWNKLSPFVVLRPDACLHLKSQRTLEIRVKKLVNTEVNMKFL